MIKFVIDYGDNKTEGAQMFSALKQAMNGAMPDPFDMLDTFLTANNVTLTEEQTKARDVYESVFDNLQIGTDHLVKVENNNETKAIEISIGIVTEHDSTIKVSIRDDYSPEETEETPSEESATEQLELPFSGEKTANEQIEEILDKKDESECNECKISSPEETPIEEAPTEVASEFIPDGMTNGSADEDGTPEVELPEHVELEDIKPVE